MEEKTRRNFLKTTSTAAVTFGMLAGTTRRGGSANDQINAAVVGVNGRGRNHISGYVDLERINVNLMAVCDVDENVLKERKTWINEEYDVEVKTYTDLQDMLTNDEIDVVSVATPNHWHSLQGIWICQAGKDAYIEKPCSHNVFEGRQLATAAKKYNRIVQHGTQIRSSAAIREAIDMLNDGIIGEVYYAKGTCYKWRNSIGHENAKPAPDGVHYNTWLGPAPDREYTDNRYHYKWHWHWDYGNGDIGNQGVHQMDVARWGLGVAIPDTVASIGGHFMFDDDQETPNTLVTTMKYEKENKMISFEVRHWVTNDELGSGGRGNVVGNLFFGSKGYMMMPSYTEYRVFLGRDRKPGPSRREGGNHFENFINAVRSRKTEDLHAPIEEGHYSSALCHYANAAYRVNDLLHIDRETELCTNNDAANELLTRNYREPFVVPKTV